MISKIHAGLSNRREQLFCNSTLLIFPVRMLVCYLQRLESKSQLFLLNWRWPPFSYQGGKDLNKMIELAAVVLYPSRESKPARIIRRHYEDFSADSSIVDELTENPSRKSLSESSCSSLNIAITCIMVGLWLGRSSKHSRAIFRYW